MKEIEQEREYLYWLCQNLSLGAVSIRRLWERFGSFETVYHEALYNIEEIQSLDERGWPEAEMGSQSGEAADGERTSGEECRKYGQGRILRKSQWQALHASALEFSQAQESHAKLAERNIRFVTPFDAEYPEKLKEIYDYPMGLFVRGQLPEPEKPSVAIVGARSCSAYGEQVAEEFARMLASEGVQIISGLALGIDGAAHRGALKNCGIVNGAGQRAVGDGTSTGSRHLTDVTGAADIDRTAFSTFGVLGCGVNICYPSVNYRLYEAMLEHGGILSEYPLDTRPAARNFPMRNRIISGLSDAVLVVEARERSGSLITAELALEQGRDVFAVPGRVTDPLSSGCNFLIQQGAHMAISPNDILEYLGMKCQKELIIHEKDVNGLAKKEKMLYHCLDFRPRHLDEILKKSGLSVGECMGILMELEFGGYVSRTANQYYVKKL